MLPFYFYDVYRCVMFGVSLALELELELILQRRGG